MAQPRPRSAEEIVSALGLSPHPEGGFYRETFRHQPPSGGRGALSVIYFLVRQGQPSAWHRIDAVETWHYYLGGALLLRVASPGRRAEEIRLGPNQGAAERLQGVVPAGAWQTAESLSEFTLAGCVTAPAFEFSGFELAPPGWSPGP